MVESRAQELVVEELELFLEPRNFSFRLHAMPLAVGMYLPWTVTVPILIGGAAYRYVDHRSRRAGDSPDVREKKIHQGLLYSSGLVAGEAIGGILIAILVVPNMRMPLLPESSTGSGALIEIVVSAAADVRTTVALEQIVLLQCAFFRFPLLES